eukprot:14518.XXX_616515_616057_1 [CDS] Oithona nana genome sequencing.
MEDRSQKRRKDEDASKEQEKRENEEYTEEYIRKQIAEEERLMKVVEEGNERIRRNQQRINDLVRFSNFTSKRQAIKIISCLSC